MPRLARPERQRLVDALAALPGIDDAAVRTRLLRDLPPALVRSIPRSMAVGQDLFALVTACEDWDPAPPLSVPPLALLIENALPLVTGTSIAATLRAVRALVVPEANGAPAPVPAVEGGPTLAALRRQLNTQFDDPSLDAFCLDHYPAVYDRFSSGMRRDAKITLLLDYCRRQPDGLLILQRTLNTAQSQV